LAWVVVSRGHLSGGGDAPNHIQRRSRCTARPRGERRHYSSTPRTRRRAEWTWVARFFAGRVCVRACGLDAKVHGVTATPRTCKPPVRQRSARSDGADYYQTPGSPPPPRRHLKTTSGARRGRLRPGLVRVSPRGGSFGSARLTRRTYEFCTAKKLRIQLDRHLSLMHTIQTVQIDVFFVHNIFWTSNFRGILNRLLCFLFELLCFFYFIHPA
jgi:hypothetical protein